VNTDVPITKIESYPHQPTRRLQTDVTSLADSIEEHGQLHPAIGRIIMGQHVLTDFDQDPAEYLRTGDAYVQLVSGHRRWQAMYEIADRAALSPSDVALEVDVRPLTDAEAAEIHYQENDEVYAQSKVQEAELMGSYKDAGWSHTEIANHFGFHRSLVPKRIKLLHFPDRVLDKIESEESDLSYAAALNVVQGWTLTRQEVRTVEEYHGKEIGDIRTHLIEVAEESTCEEAGSVAESLIGAPLEEGSPEETDSEEPPGETPDESGGAEPEESSGISAVPADLAGDGAPENGSAYEESADEESADEESAKGASPTDDSPKSDPEDALQAAQFKIEGDLQPGTYRLVAESGAGEDLTGEKLTGEEKERAARAAAQLVMALGPETDAMQDVARVVAWALGTGKDPFSALETLFRRGLEDGSLDTLSLNTTLDRA
jgi:ParB/RepB/Spo0J family partition protein